MATTYHSLILTISVPQLELAVGHNAKSMAARPQTGMDDDNRMTRTISMLSLLHSAPNLKIFIFLSDWLFIQIKNPIKDTIITYI